MRSNAFVVLRGEDGIALVALRPEDAIGTAASIFRCLLDSSDSPLEQLRITAHMLSLIAEALESTRGSQPMVVH
jgi:hypothetical protein